MGATFSSILVRSNSQDAVVQHLAGLSEEPIYISPSAGGWVGVYPEGAKATDKLAVGLSHRLSSAVFDWNVYDSDVFTYALYEDGLLRDEFDSRPGYFDSHKAEGEESKAEPIDPVQVQGKPDVLLPLCVPGMTLDAIREVLHPAELAEPDSSLSLLPPGFSDGNLQIMAKALNTTVDALKQGIAEKRREKYVFADHQATDLAALLGISASLANAGYRDIDGGDVEDPAKEEFRLIGNEGLSQEYKDAKLWDTDCLQNPERLSYWLRQGANPNARNRSGLPVILHYVPFFGNLEVLLAAGADVNIVSTRSPHLEPEYPEMRGQYEAGVTALMVAARLTESQSGRAVKAVRALLGAGAEVNARSETGRTVLSEALKMTDPLQHKKQTGRRLSEEALQEAVERSAQIVEMLREAGAIE